MGMHAGWIFAPLVVAAACDGPTQSPASTPPVTPATAAAPSPQQALDPRQCGKPGLTPAPPPATMLHNNCRHPHVFKSSDKPQSMWLSSEGIIQFRQEIGRDTMYYRLERSDGPPRLVLERIPYYKQTVLLAPGRPHMFDVGDRRVTLEQVVVGPGTRYDGAWKVDGPGPARLHAGLRVEPAPTPTHAESMPAATRCGEPSEQRTIVPSGLARHPVPAGKLTLAFGKSKPIGKEVLEYGLREFKVPGVASEMRRVLGMRDRNAPFPNQAELNRDGSEGFIRADRQLLHAVVETTDKPAKIRRYALACPATLALPNAAPGYLWLGTFGHTRVILGDPEAPTLTLQLLYGLESPTLMISSPLARYWRPLTAESVGDRYTLDGLTVEIVDVHQLADRLLPGTHVQVHITPAG